MSDPLMDFTGMAANEVIRAAQGKCRAVGCRRRAAEGRYCRAHADQAAQYARMFVVPAPGPGVDVASETSSAGSRAVDYASWVRGVWRRFEWIGLLAIVAVCLAGVLQAVTPFFVECIQMAVDGLKGAL